MLPFISTWSLNIYHFHVRMFDVAWFYCGELKNGWGGCLIICCLICKGSLSSIAIFSLKFNNEKVRSGNKHEKNLNTWIIKSVLPLYRTRWEHNMEARHWNTITKTFLINCAVEWMASWKSRAEPQHYFCFPCYDSVENHDWSHEWAVISLISLKKK